MNNLIRNEKTYKYQNREKPNFNQVPRRKSPSEPPTPLCSTEFDFRVNSPVFDFYITPHCTPSNHPAHQNNPKVNLPILNIPLITPTVCTSQFPDQNRMSMGNLFRCRSRTLELAKLCQLDNIIKNYPGATPPCQLSTLPHSGLPRCL